jgi:hypothetical protein
LGYLANTPAYQLVQKPVICLTDQTNQTTHQNCDTTFISWGEVETFVQGVHKRPQRLEKIDTLRSDIDL